MSGTLDYSTVLDARIIITTVVIRECPVSGRADVHAPRAQAWTDPLTRMPETYLCGFLSLDNALRFCEWQGWAPDPE